MRLPSFLALLLLLLPAVAHAHDGDLVQVGQTAPAFTATTAQGAPVALAVLRGQVVLLNFFATWCPPCKTELPALEKRVWAPFQRRGLALFAIGREHSVAEVAAYKKANHLSFEFLADPDRSIYARYATEYIPRCYLIGRDGRVKFATVGYEPAEFTQLIAAIDRELGHP